jgi:tetratricopeptide (TPR) repeat protein
MRKGSLALFRRTSVVVVPVVIILGLTACSERKSPARQASGWVKKGLVAHQAGRIEEASKAYQQAVKDDPQNQFGYYNLGVIAQDKGDNATAENYFRLALGIDPNFGRALFNLAVARNAAGDKAGAEALYRKDLEVDPNANAHLNLGFLLREMGRQAEGDAELIQAIQLDPSLASRIPADQPVSVATTTTTSTKPKR